MIFERFSKYPLILLFILIAIIVGFTGRSPAYAIEEETDRPKIGLALGGGGALGLAHIGVLKWLEENRIPVDYLAGTSMGGLVGGCYAMGMSPDHIEEFMLQIHWDRVFAPVPPYDSLDFRRKEDRIDYPFGTELGLKDGSINLPNGLSVHEIGLLLSRLTFPYATIDSFDELPIPYRCVAADIKRSEAVTISDGSLAEAMRATMAIPGVFTPVEWRDRLLVDGGILNNLPADVVQGMGADFTIAVNLFGGDVAPKIKGLSKILLNTIDTITIDNTRRSAKLANVEITPNSEGLTPVSWEVVVEFVERGYQAAAAEEDRLKAYALDETSWENYLRQRREKLRTKLPIPQALEITGTSGANPDIIKERLNKYLGKPLNLKKLEHDLNDLLGSGLYEGLRYGYKLADNGVPTLIIIAIEKKYGPPFLNFGFLLNVDGMNADHLDINALCRITSFNPFGLGSELRTDIGIGTEFEFSSELYKPFFPKKWFIAPSLFVNQTNSSLYEGNLKTTDYQILNAGASFDLGYIFNKYSEARWGYTLSYQEPRIKIGPELPGDLEGEIRATNFKWTYSSADGGLLDSKGLYCQLKFTNYHSGPEIDSLNQGEIKINWTQPVGRRDTILSHFSAGTSLGDTAPVLQQFCLGGPLRLGTYYTDQLRGSNYLLANIGYLKYLRRLPLAGKVYFGTWLEYGGVFEDWSEPELKTNLTMGFLSPTVFGPVFLGASYGEGDNPFFNIMIGKIF
ncbi:MAG: BamA/TamA family outer membrane protein [Firmicutes bacterium]|nr:BamA/TamA family outer membrane protein [Bacillota bacterium]